MSKAQIRKVTKTCDFGQFGEIDVDFTVRYFPGVPPSGTFGPPEDYDPGDGSTVEFIKAEIRGENESEFFETITLIFPETFEDFLDEICLELDEDGEDDHDE